MNVKRGKLFAKIFQTEEQCEVWGQRTSWLWVQATVHKATASSARFCSRSSTEYSDSRGRQEEDSTRILGGDGKNVSYATAQPNACFYFFLWARPVGPSLTRCCFPSNCSSPQGSSGRNASRSSGTVAVAFSPTEQVTGAVTYHQVAASPFRGSVR